jgi:hypothetical protein
VVIDNFDVIHIAIGPDKAYSPLVVDAYAVLAFAVGFQCFQVVAGRLSQILKNLGAMQVKQFASRWPFNCTKPWRQNIVKQRFSVFAFEGFDHA